jgi:hypothetical protein
MSDERVSQTTTHEVGVDSGTIWIGDPCYLVGLTREDWEAAVEAVHAKNADPDLQNVSELRNGQWISTLYGDGSYEVTVERNEHGRPVRVTIDFTQSHLNPPIDDEWR